MATSLSRTLIRRISSPNLAKSLQITRRYQSGQSGNNNPVIILEQPDLEALMVQRIEDAIHGIIVKRSAPDWLPFRPGSSYWVPPRKESYGIAELVENFSNNLTEEEVMSLTVARGWPSSAFFTTNDASLIHSEGRGEDESKDQCEDLSEDESEEDTTSTDTSQSKDME